VTEVDDDGEDASVVSVEAGLAFDAVLPAP
jgi:hypothetical protein